MTGSGPTPFVFDNFPLVNLDEYRRVGHYETDFLRAAKPEWITEATSGDASISYNNSRGGYALVTIGPTSVDDYGALRFGASVSPANYDVVVLRVNVEGRHDASIAQNRTTMVGQTSGNSINAMRDYDYLNFAGSNEDLPEKNWDDGPIEQYIVWDVERDRAFSLVGGLASTLRSPVGIDPEDDYTINFLHYQTKDTTTTRFGRLFGAELSLYSR